jgi:UrcA family protein
MNSSTSRFNTLRRTAILSAFGALVVGSTAGMAQAATFDDAAPTVKVVYGDLNLTSAQGISTLYARIVSAARQACNVEDIDIRDLQRFVAAQSCESTAIAQAVKSVPSPQLAVLSGAHPHQG